MKKITAKFNAKILVADDYIVNQELTKEMLEMMDCVVDVAEDGRQALEIIRNNQYDLIFMDVQMPEKDGYAVTKEIRAFEGKSRHTPIIAITANALVGDRERCLEAGMDDYISKPIKGIELENVLQKHIPQCKRA